MPESNGSNEDYSANVMNKFWEIVYGSVMVNASDWDGDSPFSHRTSQEMEKVSEAFDHPTDSIPPKSWASTFPDNEEPDVPF